MKLTKTEIMKIIPHRDPFLFVDEIVEITDKYAVGIKNVSDDEKYLKGHFPNNPVMPGVLFLEMIAQVGAVALLKKNDFKGKQAYFTSVKKAKFKKKVKPQEKLVIKTALTKLRGNFGVANGEIYSDDELVCEAEISFAIMEDR